MVFSLFALFFFLHDFDSPSSDELVKVFEGVGEKIDLATFKKLFAKKMPTVREQAKPMLDAFKALVCLLVVCCLFVLFFSKYFFCLCSSSSL